MLESIINVRKTAELGFKSLKKKRNVVKDALKVRLQNRECLNL